MVHIVIAGFVPLEAKMSSELPHYWVPSNLLEAKEGLLDSVQESSSFFIPWILGEVRTNKFFPVMLGFFTKKQVSEFWDILASESRNLKLNLYYSRSLFQEQKVLIQSLSG